MRSITARERTLWRNRAGHHGLHAEDVEGELEPRASDLGRVAESPELGAQRPADLEPMRMRSEREVDVVRHSHPRLGREECVDLTPVVVNRSARQAAATDDLAARAVVGDPFVDAVEPPRVAHELGPLLGLFSTRLPAVIPAGHRFVVVHEPQVTSVGQTGGLEPQASSETGVRHAGQSEVDAATAFDYSA